jgi:hypothetical protein
MQESRTTTGLGRHASELEGLRFGIAPGLPSDDHSDENDGLHWPRRDGGDSTQRCNRWIAGWAFADAAAPLRRWQRLQ